MRPSHRFCIAVWGAAAGVRLLYLIVVRPPFTIYYYWDIASSLLKNGSVSVEGAQTASADLLYPLFLAAMRLVVGDRPLLIQAVQALIAAAGAVYLCKLTAALTDSRRAAIAAAALFSVYPLLIRHSVDGTDSALLTTSLIAFAYYFVTARSAIDGVAAGTCLGIAMLARTVAWPLVVIAPLVAAARSRRVAIAMTGTALAILTPALARTYAVSGALVPTRDGVNLFKANCEYASGVMAAYSVDVLGPYAESRLAAFGLADIPLTPAIERQRSTAYRRLALDEMRSHPFATLWLKIRNVFYFFSPVLVPYRLTTAATTIRLGVNGVSVVENTIERPLGHRLSYSLSYSLVVVLAAIGVYPPPPKASARQAHRRDGLRPDAILWCILFTFAAVHAIFFPTTRYRAPVDFVFLFYAAVGLDTLMGAGDITPWHRSSASHVAAR
ncbi:MAG TPA: glycosyltransferase family 39 protein [Vicinamibacterales bacterium]